MQTVRNKREPKALRVLSALQVEALGVQSLAVQVDLRDVDSCVRCVAAVIAKFNRVDILINNASALWWQGIENTPINKYDLITGINARGYVHAHEHVPAHAPACTCMCLHIPTCTCTFSFTCACTSALFFACIPIPIHSRSCTRIRSHIDIGVHTQTGSDIRVHICIYIEI